MGAARGEFAQANYGRVAHIYDKLEIFQGGLLEKTRNAFLGQLPFLPRNPIILGCGTGSFAAAFVRTENPARLTINDIASEMLAVSRHRIRATGWNGDLITLEGDFASLGLPPDYDFVAAQFFLDCFPQRLRLSMLSRVKRIMTPGAVLLVSDYARPRSPWMLPVFYINYGTALLAFWILAGHAPNMPGDIEAAILDSGWRVLRKQTFFLGLFASWLAAAE